MWKPVFFGDEIVCYVGGHIQNTDMGGAVPASLSRTLTGIYQEGIRFAPTKIVRAGVLDEVLREHMAINVRAPEQNRGDLKAQIAMPMTGERRVLEIIGRFRIEQFRAGMDALLEYSEEQARIVVRSMPEGEYFFAEYADEDSVNGRLHAAHQTRRGSSKSIFQEGHQTSGAATENHHTRWLRGLAPGRARDEG